MKKYRPHPFAEVKPRPKTIKVICAACTEHYYLTITALPMEYANALRLMRCTKCGVGGKLCTSDLAKARPRVRDTQLQLDFRKKPS